MTLPARKLRVVVVDDSAFMRKAISSMIAEDPEIDVVGVARNGREGLEMAASLKPDAMTMDIEMPEMDGLTALRRIMAECPVNVIMLSSLTTEGSHAALTALQLGAADVLAKEQSHVSLGIIKLKDELLRRIKAVGRTRPTRRAVAAAAGHSTQTLGTVSPTLRPERLIPARLDLVCIGSSTGGPPVVERVLRDVPTGFPAPIVVAQHMPEVFTRSMSERLRQVCKVPVHHLDPGASILPGNIYICPGGQNTHLRRVAGKLSASINREPASTIYFPSVDVLLQTAAGVAGAGCLGIVLTGMGDDGGKGAVELKNAGGILLGQSAETCVVYGMPRAVYERGVASAMLPPNELAAVLASAGKSVLRKAG